MLTSYLYLRNTKQKQTYNCTDQKRTADANNLYKRFLLFQLPNLFNPHHRKDKFGEFVPKVRMLRSIN
jgi:hypothetical protein